MLIKTVKVHKKGLPKEFAIITGVNVKCIETETSKKGNLFPMLIFHWGLILNLTLEDGTKIDCVWKMLKTKHYNSSTQSIIGGRTPESLVHDTSIPFILKACGVNELSELVGTVVKVRRNKNSIRIHCNDSVGFWLFADMFEIHESDDPDIKVMIPEAFDVTNDDDEAQDSLEESTGIPNSERIKAAADLVQIRVDELLKIRRPALVNKLIEFRDEMLVVLGVLKDSSDGKDLDGPETSEDSSDENKKE